MEADKLRKFFAIECFDDALNWVMADLTVIIIGASISFIEALYFEPVRLVEHALAAIFIVHFLFVSFFLGLRQIVRYMKLWVLICVSSKRVQKMSIRLTKSIARLALVFLPGLLYALYCYCWESAQAQDFQREIQYGQLTVDFVFVLLTTLFNIVMHYKCILLKTKKITKQRAVQIVRKMVQDSYEADHYLMVPMVLFMTIPLQIVSYVGIASYILYGFFEPLI